MSGCQCVCWLEGKCWLLWAIVQSGLCGEGPDHVVVGMDGPVFVHRGWRGMPGMGTPVDGAAVCVQQGLVRDQIQICHWRELRSVGPRIGPLLSAADRLIQG